MEESKYDFLRSMFALVTSSMVHLHSSLLPVPDYFKQPFPLSVQHRFTTKQAPRGGLQPLLA